MALLGGTPSGSLLLKAYWEQFLKIWPKNLNRYSRYLTKHTLLLVAQLI